MVLVIPASADRFDDVAAVLNPNGNDKACWCLAYRAPNAENRRLVGAERGDYVRRLCADDLAPGVLAYADDEPVGWCGVGPRSSFERLKRSRTIPRVDERPVWSVVCFVVRAGHRRKGVARALLEGAVAYARECGAPAVEGYPADNAGARFNSTAAHVGTVGLFESVGFERVRQTSAHADRLPRWLVRRNFPSGTEQA